MVSRHSPNWQTRKQEFKTETTGDAHEEIKAGGNGDAGRRMVGGHGVGRAHLYYVPRVLSEVVNGVVTNMAAKSATLEVRFYATPTGGAARWGREVPVTLDDGAFNMEISDSAGSYLEGETSLESVLLSATNTLFIGLTVKGGAEITPRQRMLSAAYAVSARGAEKAPGSFPVGGALSVQGGATLNGGAAIKNGLVVSGATTLSNAVTVKGVMTLSTNLVVSPPATISGYGTVPIGFIGLWYGATNAIPDGWALCTGQTVNGYPTPDLRDRFVVGAGNAYAVGAKGGTDTVTLAVAQMPAHSHGYVTKTSQPYWGTADKYWPTWTGEQTVQTSTTGGNQAHENRPPYYALCYIMRIR